MKLLNGKEAMRGDVIIAPTPDGTVVAGVIHTFYDRTEQIGIGGYPLRILAKTAVLAQDAYEAIAPRS